MGIYDISKMTDELLQKVAAQKDNETVTDNSVKVNKNSSEPKDKDNKDTKKSDSEKGTVGVKKEPISGGMVGIEIPMGVAEELKKEAANLRKIASEIDSISYDDINNFFEAIKNGK